MFGELIGLWIAAVWRQIGSPENVRIVELGPGRGTMMNDALRAAQVMPGFCDAAVVHLVEISPALEKRQRDTLDKLNIPVNWHKALLDVPADPSIIVANEFFDALPVHQAVKQGEGWHERLIAIGPDGHFTYAVAPESIPHFEAILPPQVRAAPEGAIFEWRDDSVAYEIGRRIAGGKSAALVIDYGHAQSAFGETFQAVGGHAFADPLIAPGSADLTAHVDFQALTRAVESMGAAVYGPIEQSEFLRRLGIRSRASALKANARSAAKAAEIDAALARLIGHGRTGMGEMFKAIAFIDPSLGAPPAFDR